MNTSKYLFSNTKTVFLLLFTFAMHINICAQTDSVIITSTPVNVEMIEYLNKVESKYPISFYFNESWFRDRRITATFNQASLPEFLNTICEDIPYIYEVMNDSLVVFLPRERVTALLSGYNTIIKKNNINTIVIGDPNEAGKHTEVVLHGRVTDKLTGEPVVGANIALADVAKGVTTDVDGGYELVLRPGFYKLSYSSLGYERNDKEIKIISNGTLNIELFEEAINLNEVSILGQKIDRNVTRNQMSIIELDIKTIDRLPSITGEKDIIKGLTLMAGVKSVGEFGSGIHVRGGGEDQNLYLVEGAPVFNTAHVFGLISVINPDAVSNLTLYKGHIPALYGERVSSVMEINLRDNSIEDFSLKGGIGLFNSRLLIEAPVVKKKISFLFGGRTSYSDWLLNRMNDYYLKNSSASFYDLNAKINIKHKNSNIAISGYKSHDKFKYANKLGYEYGNTLASFRWGRIFKHGIASALTFAYSNYEVFRDNIEKPYLKNRVESSVTYYSGKYNISYTELPKHDMDMGANIIKYQIAPGKKSPLEETSFIHYHSLEREQATEYAVYINDKFDINPNISLSAGIRYSFYNLSGPGKIYNYAQGESISDYSITDSTLFNSNQKMVTYKALEPRVSFKFQFSKQNSLKLSYNKNTQYISLISYTAIATPDDRWKLADKYIKPVIANQVALGYYHNFLSNTIETSVEFYYKDLKNISEYKNNAQIVMNYAIERELLNASGINYGVEFMLKKNSGKLDGWLSYTWSRAMRKTDGKHPDEIINNNSYFPSAYDKPHDLSVVLNYNINKRLRIGTSFLLSSGRPVTLPELSYPAGNHEIVSFSSRNKYRLPAYHRLDLSLSIDESLRKSKKWKGRWTFSILNVYARKNAYSVFYKRENPSYSNNFKRYGLYKMYIIGKPLPTVTYSFIF